MAHDRMGSVVLGMVVVLVKEDIVEDVTVNEVLVVVGSQTLS